MKIGFVSTWFERGAAYVTKNYINALKEDNEIFLYARGGEKFEKGNPNWDKDYVTWGYKLTGTKISFRHFSKWIIENNIEIIFFNEQNDFEILYYVKENFPNIKIGSYIDYYKEDMVEDFDVFDFLICNTKRHYSVFEKHPQAYYIPWGVDLDLYKPQIVSPSSNVQRDKVTFFHSVGMSLRKGTSTLIETFISEKIYEKSNLVVHSQLNFYKTFGYTEKELTKYNIELIEGTITAPGLYYLGDVYVYPTTLDGLGLTLYEAIACGMPVITTDNAPMNEVINDEIGRLVEVDKLYSRSNGYYWPLAIVNQNSLAESMNYYIENFDLLEKQKVDVRKYAVQNYDWNDRVNKIQNVFYETKILSRNTDFKEALKKNRIKKRNTFIKSLMDFLPDRIESFINNKIR